MSDYNGVAFFLGKMYPQHVGHEFVISCMMKKKYKKIIIMVCYNDTQHYDTEYMGDRLTHEDRLVAMQDFVEQHRWKLCPETQIVIEFFDDSHMPTAEESDVAVSQAWAEMIHHRYDNLTDLYGSEEYVRYMAGFMEGVTPHVVDLQRVVNPVSGTKCRTNLIGNWDKLAHHYKEKLNYRIAIMGAESTGKSTLARNTAYWNQGTCVMIPEQGRIHMTHPELSKRDLELFAIRQYNQMQFAAVEKPISIIDTTCITTEMFCPLYGIKSELVGELAMLENIDLYVVLKPLVEFEQDGMRVMTEYETRQTLTNALISRLECDHQNFIVIDESDPEKRMEIMNNIIKEAIETMSK